MIDELGVLRLVTGRLDAAGIAYMLTGSIAAGYYSEPRMTRDIDLVVELETSDAERVAALFGSDFMAEPETIASAIRRRGMFNMIHTAAAVKVDMIVRKETPYRREEFSRRRQIAIDSQPMWLVSPEDLILSKLEWSKNSQSELQRRDVRGLLRDTPDLDQVYMDQWASRLGIRDVLDEARQV
jgi:hypothetical protein